MKALRNHIVAPGAPSSAGSGVGLVSAAARGGLAFSAVEALFDQEWLSTEPRVGAAGSAFGGTVRWFGLRLTAARADASPAARGGCAPLRG